MRYDLSGLNQRSAVLPAAQADRDDRVVMISGKVVGSGSDPRLGSAC
jgi:hypothetical protein